MEEEFKFTDSQKKMSGNKICYSLSDIVSMKHQIQLSYRCKITEFMQINSSLLLIIFENNMYILYDVVSCIMRDEGQIDYNACLINLWGEYLIYFSIEQKQLLKQKIFPYRHRQYPENLGKNLFPSQHALNLDLETFNLYIGVCESRIVLGLNILVLTELERFDSAENIYNETTKITCISLISEQILARYQVPDLEGIPELKVWPQTNIVYFILEGNPLCIAENNFKVLLLDIKTNLILKIKATNLDVNKGCIAGTYTDQNKNRLYIIQSIEPEQQNQQYVLNIFYLDLSTYFQTSNASETIEFQEKAVLLKTCQVNGYFPYKLLNAAPSSDYLWMLEKKRPNIKTDCTMVVYDISHNTARVLKRISYKEKEFFINQNEKYSIKYSLRMNEANEQQLLIYRIKEAYFLLQHDKNATMKLEFESFNYQRVSEMGYRLLFAKSKIDKIYTEQTQKEILELLMDH